ncbi:PrgI family protein [Sphingobium sp. CFD-2]|uniref:PrgI family protein n=1 Tax=Sphingobium sp. CFD-2 TaxID=2878542 RepID=UPI00214B2668|nr:PrgI family protein [Sphingobium sp. CFD-2]
MKGQRSEPSDISPVPTWSSIIWTLIMAAAAYGIYFLRHHRILTEEQLMLLLFVMVPIAAFLLSGYGQDRSAEEAGLRHRKDRK